MSARPALKSKSSQARAWHREFWPWFIVALIGSVVLASVATIFLAFKFDDAAAVGNYQREGLGVVKMSPQPEPSK